LSADAAVAAEFQQQRYVVMDLGTLPQGYWTMPSAISPHALLITGTSGQAFFWDGAMHSLGLVNGGPTAVNDSGIVVGGYYPGNPGSAQAFRWERGTTTNLPTLGGLTSWATSINRDGVVAGWADRADGFSRAVYWTSKGPVDLGSLGGAWSACSTAWGINSAGIVVGTSCVANSGTHAVRFRGPGEIDDLGTFGGYSATARAINDAGVIVGLASYADATTHGFVYADGKATDVGALPGTRYSQLVAINGSGVAVGSSSDGGSGRGVVYGAGRMMDLNSLVERSPFTIIGASGIDEAGNIVAQGLDLGSSRAVLLRPH
jgi:probable HAF family extracellular repeat protein